MNRILTVKKSYFMCMGLAGLLVLMQNYDGERTVLWQFHWLCLMKLPKLSIKPHRAHDVFFPQLTQRQRASAHEP